MWVYNWHISVTNGGHHPVIGCVSLYLAGLDGKIIMVYHPKKCM